MALDPNIYQQWWPLHLRVARGETLRAEEDTFYQSTRRQLEAEEAKPATRDESLCEARAAVTSLEAERAGLEAQRLQLQTDIAALEALLGRRTRQLLGAQG